MIQPPIKHCISNNLKYEKPFGRLNLLFCKYNYLPLLTLLFLFFSSQICYADQDAPSTSEYALKAVCLYNFTHFAYWPAAKEPKKAEPVIIGVVGRSPFVRAFEDLQAHLQETHKKNISIIYHGPYREGMDLRQSHRV